MQPSGDISPEDRAFLVEVVRVLRDRASGRVIVPQSWRRYLSDALKGIHKNPRGRPKKSERNLDIVCS